MKNPFKPRALPPHSSLAPSLMPLWTNSSTQACCSRLICGGDVEKDSKILERTLKKKTKKKLQTCLSNLRALFSSGIKGAADYPPLGSLHAPPNKLVVDGLLHVDTRACCAALARVEKHALVGLFYGQVH